MLNILKIINKLTRKKLPFKIGDEVFCNWGSGGEGYTKKGIVIDPLVNYNNAIKFSIKACEPACIIRFDCGQKTWDGKLLGIHEVVPYRLIKKQG